MTDLVNTFVVFLTARSEEYSEVAAFDVGADDYITKPIKPRALMMVEFRPNPHICWCVILLPVYVRALVIKRVNKLQITHPNALTPHVLCCWGIYSTIYGVLNNNTNRRTTLR